MKLFIRLEPPYEWVRIGATVEAFGEVHDIAEYPFAEENELVGVVSGDHVTSHSLSLPARSRKQFQLAVPYALEELVSEDVDDLHFTVCDWKQDQENTVYVVAKEKLLEWQKIANKHKLPIDRLVPEYVLIPLHNVADCTLVQIEAAEQSFLSHHKTGTGATIENNFFSAWLADLPLSSVIAVNDESFTEKLISEHEGRDIRFWDIGNKMAHWLEVELDLKLDLFADGFRPTVRKLSLYTFRWPVMLVLMAIFCIFLYDSYRYFAMHKEIKMIDQEQAAILQRRFPELAGIDPGRERVLMEKALRSRSEQQVENFVTHALGQVAQIARSQAISLNEISFRNSALTIVFVLKNFSQVDQINSQLNKRANIQSRLESSAAENGIIYATYTLTQK